MPAPRRQIPSEGKGVAHEICWAKTLPDGKPGISVRDHCLNVGCVAEALLELMPAQLRDLLPLGAATLAALHDVGKVSPGFQQKCPAWVTTNKPWFNPENYEGRHQRISQIFLESFCSGRIRKWAEAIGAHHGRVQGTDPGGDMGGEPWEQARRQLLRALTAEFGPLPESDAFGEAQEWLLAGLITVADWLGSDEKKFSAEARGLLDKATQRAKADDTVRRLELANAGLTQGRSFEEVFAQRLVGSQPRPLQKAIMETPRPSSGVYVIEDAMGSGKTEAALWLAYRLMATGQARGLYFGLPTRVTSDRIHRRVKEFLAEVYQGGVEPPLVHGHAWLREIPSTRPAWKGSNEKDGEESPWMHVEAAQKWFASARRGLLAPFAVGTVDQALLGVVAAKWFFVRQFALAGKVVVLDEVHSYDLYTGTLIAHLVRRLRELHATPVILSATLTAKQRAGLLGEAVPSHSATAPYPAITMRRDDAPSQPMPVKSHATARPVRLLPLTVPNYDDIQTVVSLAAKLAAEGRNVVWIRNTVRHAQEAYRRLNAEKQGDAFEAGLLHSRFPAFQRGSYPKLTLEELKERHLHEERWLWMLGKPEPPRADVRPHGCVLIATQVVEQSVDIDADVLITDLAPTDMLLQRLGRLHRHDRGDRGQPAAYLVVPQHIATSAQAMSADEIRGELGSIGRVYSPYVLVRTWKQWRRRRQVVLPTEIRKLLEATYADGAKDPKGWGQLKEDLERERDRLENLARRAADVRGRELEEDEESLLTRFSKQRQTLLLLLRWVSGNLDKAGNSDEVHLFNGCRLGRENYRQFNLYAARQLHLNAATIPAWWLPKSFRAPLPPGLAQYFGPDAAMAVYDGRYEELQLSLRVAVGKPSICYHPLEGLWLEKPPDRRVIRREEDGEGEDGMF